MEKNFEKNGFNAEMAGWESIEYIDHQYIESNYKHNGKAVVLLSPGKTFCKVEAETITADVKSENGGFNTLVDAQFNGQGSEDGHQIFDLQKTRVALRLTDYNGIQWLAGCKETPLRVSIDDLREADATGSSSYTLHFSGKTWWPLTRL